MPNWNESKDHYEFYYSKYGCIHRVELDIRDDLLHVLIRRLNDFKDVKSQINIKKHINIENYKNFCLDL
jgi:hypothetical protein